MTGRDNLRGLQYLRAVAAIMVVWHHARGLFAPGMFPDDVGMAGVDVFFVLSGFLMVYTTRRAPSTGAAFLKRRIVRIVPLYWLALASTALIQARSAPVSPFWLIRDFLFIPHRDQAGNILPLVAPGWTLNYEMFFYLLFATTIALSIRGQLLAIGLAFAALTSSSLLISWERVPMIWYTRPIVWEFFFGMALSVAWRNGLLGVGRRWGAAFVLAGWAWILLGPSERIEERRVMVYGVGALLVVFGTLVCTVDQKRSIRWLGALGDASYSIYLTHLMVLVVVRKLLGSVVDLLSLSRPQAVVFALISIAIACLAGLLSFWVVERPLTEWVADLLQGRPRQKVTASGSSIVEAPGPGSIVLAEGSLNPVTGGRQVPTPREGMADSPTRR
jgi:exopolysaccharide production protein ExoZ